MSNSRITPELQLSIYALWGKKASNGDPRWLPLITHLADTAEIGKLLWDEWLCEGAKQNIANNCFYATTLNVEEKLQRVRALFVFLCASHDLGKATPAFQRKTARPSYAGLLDQRDRNERQSKCFDLDDIILKRLQIAALFCPRDIPERIKTPHALCSQVILLKHAGNCAANVAAILGAHHGKPQKNNIKASLFETYPLNFYADNDNKASWESVQAGLYQWALTEAGFDAFSNVPQPNLVASAELCGLLVMADWISSNEWLFPYIPMDAAVHVISSANRARRGFERLHLTHRWQPSESFTSDFSVHNYYARRFEILSPNNLQQVTMDVVRSLQQPGILVIEAPMGYGKTETALAAAEMLAQKSGRTGVFFALPTQATSNGIFPRLTAWIHHFGDAQSHSVKLFHARAEFNDDWKNLQNEEERRLDTMTKTSNGDTVEEEDDTLIVNDWFSGRKKAMLADFVVGTIDQLLMGAFKHKHLMLRHLGLSNKVVVIDECHAYDAYMSVYLERILEWLGKYQIPTIVLSATLPSDKRITVINAYQGNTAKTHIARSHDCDFFDIPDEMESIQPDWMTTRAYPVITYTDGKDVRIETIPRDTDKRSVQICKLSDDDLANDLSIRLEKGGCAGIIVNSVTRAQKFYKVLAEEFGQEKVILFHSRFLMPDRAEIEKTITGILGKPDHDTHRPDFMIVIGTQVLEQSLDIDFDVLYTDIAPMDLLIQRMGRLHRHHRTRPIELCTPVCHVLGIQDNATFDRASVAVYGNYLLMRTSALLPHTICIPDDISGLVDDVYSDHCQIAGLPADRYDEATKRYLNVIMGKEGRAKTFRLGPANTSRRSSLNGWLDCDGGNVEETAAVRDIQESLEVIFVREGADGYLHLMDDDQTPISRNETPSDDMAREILKYSLTLPIGIVQNFDATLSILEKCCEPLSIWQKSRWLKGNIILILDINGQFKELPGFVLTYSKSEGLSYQKEQTNA